MIFQGTVRFESEVQRQSVFPPSRPHVAYPLGKGHTELKVILLLAPLVPMQTEGNNQDSWAQVSTSPQAI